MPRDRDKKWCDSTTFLITTNKVGVGEKQRKITSFLCEFCGGTYVVINGISKNTAPPVRCTRLLEYRKGWSRKGQTGYYLEGWYNSKGLLVKKIREEEMSYAKYLEITANSIGGDLYAKTRRG